MRIFRTIFTFATLALSVIAIDDWNNSDTYSCALDRWQEIKNVFDPLVPSISFLLNDEDLAAFLALMGGSNAFLPNDPTLDFVKEFFAITPPEILNGTIDNIMIPCLATFTDTMVGSSNVETIDDENPSGMNTDEGNVTEEITSEEKASEEATSEGNTFENTTSEETAIEETTSEDTTSEEGSSDTLTSAENNTNTDTDSSTDSSILSPINSSTEIIIDYSPYSSSQAYTSSELHHTYSPVSSQYPTDSENNGYSADTTHSRQQTKTRSAEKTGIYSTNGSYATDSVATSSKSYATDDAQTETPASSVDKTGPYTTETYSEKTSTSVYTAIPAPGYNTSDHRNGNHHHPRC